MATTGTKRSRNADDDDTSSTQPSKKPATAGNRSSYLDKAQEAGDATSVSPAVDHPSQSSKPTSKASIEKITPISHSQLPTQPPSKRPADDDSAEPPRPRKRPGAAARISTADKEAFLARQKQREEEALKAVSTRGIDDAVRQHYNAVPQRGRDWRSTESRIKGLRKFNNWVKSTIIHRFSPPESGDGPPIRVLDIGCGKGGDLGKWQSAPHPVDLYIGIDPAEVSIDQARERYSEMMRCGGRGGWRGGREQRAFDAEFIAQDAFSQSVGNIPIVRNVGFLEDRGSRWGSGGFDVVTMMFCMHYAFESEAKTKRMLNNVAGSLKKGGRFFGVIPNSDIIRANVEAFHKRKPRTLKGQERERSVMGLEGSPSTNQTEPSRGTRGPASEDLSDNSNGPATELDGQPDLIARGRGNSQSRKTDCPLNNKEDESTRGGIEKDSDVEWGNSIYRVRFAGKTPEDGIFRPPFGWKYNYFMEEAVEEVPEYVVPWEAFRA